MNNFMKLKFEGGFDSKFIKQFKLIDLSSKTCTHRPSLSLFK